MRSTNKIIVALRLAILTAALTVAAAAQAGAYAVLYKDAEPEALFEVIREAAYRRIEFGSA